MRALTLVLALLSGGAVAADPAIKLAVPGLQGVNVTEEALTFYAEHLAQNLRAPGLMVVTAREIRTLLGFERQKELLGCNDAASSCLAELANALGVDAVVIGDVARFGDTFQINAKVVSASDATLLAQSARRVQGEVETLEAMAALARELGRGVFEKKGRPVPTELRAQAAAGVSVKKLGWVPLGVGVAVAAAGGVLLFLAQGDAAALTGPGEPLSDMEARALRDGGSAKQLAGGISLAVGLTAAAVGVGMLIFGPGDAPVVSVAPVPGGAGVVLTGVLP